MAATYSLISANTLTGTAASVTFSAIPSTYTDLVLRCSARSDAVNTVVGLNIALNATSANYSVLYLGGTGTATDTYKDPNLSNWYAPYAISAANQTSNTFSNAEIYIPSYTASQNKPASFFTADETNATAAYIYTTAALWRNTAAITSIALTLGAGSFVSGSSFYLYGIKNS